MLSLRKDKYKQLFLVYYNPLCNFAFKIVQDKEVAKDIVNDVFLSYWNKLNSKTEFNNAKSYLFTSTKNKCLESLRRKKIESKYAEWAKKNLSTSTQIDNEATKYMRKEQLYASIRQLPPKCREVFMMSKQNGLTYVEIAEELDISIKTVENHMGRAMRILRELMNPKNT